MSDSIHVSTSEALRLRQHRAKRAAEGRSFITIDLPNEIIAAADAIKTRNRFAGRAPVIEEALKLYLIDQREA